MTTNFLLHDLYVINYYIEVDVQSNE
uniref:Uncharacterized protein n=1 Tax=Arundo donax TaxID=35708 RepID=A0A0A8ZAI7_ARUDO